MSSKSVTNILFSTTRGWNPGDEFILRGIINLLKPIMGEFNPIIFNRHPELHNLERDFNTQPINYYHTLKPHWKRFDNSWREQSNLANIDYVIFAGTPEWLAKPVDPLLKFIVEKNIPTLYMGIGSFENIAHLRLDDLPQLDRTVLQNARLITVRDTTCAKILSPLTTKVLPCPALFAANDQTLRSNLQRIALSMQGIQTINGQRIDPANFEFCLRLFKRLNQEFDCSLVCHYIKDLEELQPYLGNDMPFRYSYNADDYLNIYDEFDLTITTRVHGAGLCASLGIPALHIAHSKRSETASGFLSEAIHPQNDTIDNIVAKVKALDIQKMSRKLFAHKTETRKHYNTLLKPILACKDNIAQGEKNYA